MGDQKGAFLAGEEDSFMRLGKIVDAIRSSLDCPLAANDFVRAVMQRAADENVAADAEAVARHLQQGAAATSTEH